MLSSDLPFLNEKGREEGRRRWLEERRGRGSDRFKGGKVGRSSLSSPNEKVKNSPEYDVE